MDIFNIDNDNIHDRVRSASGLKNKKILAILSLLGWAGLYPNGWPAATRFFHDQLEPHKNTMHIILFFICNFPWRFIGEPYLVYMPNQAVYVPKLPPCNQ